MGKRSDFERVERDFYETPVEAVFSLVRHLPDKFTYAEPCCGNNQLIMNLAVLTAGRGACIQRGDIQDGFDAKKETIYDETDLIITNPPWTRSELHPIIENLSDQKPTWLLFDADWMHTKQSRPYLSRLRKIVSIGRVKWFPESKMTGKDNCCWYLFSTPKDEDGFIPRIYFVGRQDD